MMYNRRCLFLIVSILSLILVLHDASFAMDQSTLLVHREPQMKGHLPDNMTESITASFVYAKNRYQMPPIDFTIELLSGNKMALGQPVLLRYKITNMSQGVIAWEPGDDFERWFTLQLTDGIGQEVPIERPNLSKLPVPPDGGFHTFGNPMIRRGDSATGYILLTRFYPILKKGIYNLVVKVKTHYTPVVAADERRDLDELKEYINSGSVYKKEFSYVLNIGSENRGHLVKVSEDLRKALLESSSKSFRQIQSLGDAISALPEENAIAVWRQLINEKKINRNFLGDKISKIGTVRAVILLEELQWDNALASKRKDNFNSFPYFMKMYYDGNIDVQKRILQILRRHDIVFEPKLN